MSFSLKIRISGLCLLVPSRDRHYMHVLMPTTGRHHERHYPVIIYDPASTTQGAASASTDVGVKDIETRTLTIGASDTATTDYANFAGKITNLSSLHARYVPRGWLDVANPTLSDKVAVRVTLKGGASSGEPSKGAYWKYKGKTREMSPAIEWLINDYEGDCLKLEIGGDGLTLFPVGGILEFGIYHVPWADLLPCSHESRPLPKPGDWPAHLGAIRDMLGITDHDWPEYEAPPQLAEGASPEETRGIDPFICMLTSGCPADDPDCPPDDGGTLLGESSQQRR